MKSCIIHPSGSVFDHKCYFPWETISHIQVRGLNIDQSNDLPLTNNVGCSLDQDRAPRWVPFVWYAALRAPEHEQMLV